MAWVLQKLLDGFSMPQEGVQPASACHPHAAVWGPQCVSIFFGGRQSIEMAYEDHKNPHRFVWKDSGSKKKWWPKYCKRKNTWRKINCSQRNKLACGLCFHWPQKTWESKCDVLSKQHNKSFKTCLNTFWSLAPASHKELRWGRKKTRPWELIYILYIYIPRASCTQV